MFVPVMRSEPPLPLRTTACATGTATRPASIAAHSSRRSQAAGAQRHVGSSTATGAIMATDELA